MEEERRDYLSMVITELAAVERLKKEFFTNLREILAEKGVDELRNHITKLRSNGAISAGLEHELLRATIEFFNSPEDVDTILRYAEENLDMVRLIQFPEIRMLMRLEEKARKRRLE